LLVADSDEGRVGRIPLPGGEARGPDRLLLRADDAVLAVALEFPAMARIEERVVAPARRLEHDRSTGREPSPALHRHRRLARRPGLPLRHLVRRDPLPSPSAPM